ncbi:uncharacterized protein METZ01_LOCUS394015, partial [marine metagenome]
VSVDDLHQLLSASGAPTLAPELIFDELDWWSIENRIETRFTKDGEFERRFGVHLEAYFEYFIDNDEYNQRLSVPLFLDWHKVFDDPTNLAKDRMFYYGPDGLEAGILERTGIEFDGQGWEDHDYTSKETVYQFVAKRAIMLQVDEAYRVTAGTIERLRPFNENANAKRSGKAWINKRLTRAFNKCKEDNTKKWSEEFDNETKSVERQIKKLKKFLEIEGLENSNYPSGAIKQRKERLNELITRLEEGKKEKYLQHNDRKLEFAKFLYPKRKIEYYVDSEGEKFEPALN